MIKKILLLTFVTVFGMISVNARNINVNGHIVLKGKGTKEAAAGASILDAETQRLLGVADEDGKYQITVDSEGEIIFSFMGAEPRQERVKGRHFINVELVPQTKLLEEVFVQAKGGKKSALAVEPTDLDVEGNTLRFKTKVKLPARMFNSSKRLIVQPAILNVTRNRVSFLKPVVFDGWRYAATQERMHDWDKTVDPLSKYQEIKAADNLDNTIYLLDSLYIENPKDDFSGFVIASLENYNKVCYKDTFEVARGTVNPLRFLSYSLTPVNLTEERYLPSPEVELRDTKGEMNLIFPVGKSKLDLSLGNNAAELKALTDEFRRIAASPDMSLRSFTINGFASPEGNMDRNKALAEERMRSAMENVVASIDPSLRRNAEITSHAGVAGWEEVAKMLRADGLTEEANKVQEIINSTKNNDNRYHMIARLPFYKSLIVEKYLPRLRRVNYNITTSVYRPLNEEEIDGLYLTNPKGLTKYQYYRYYTSKEGDEREKALRQAVETYPDFLAAATDLSEIMINKGEDATTVLERFFEDPEKWSRLPESTRLNMAIANMQAMQFEKAEEILETLPDNEYTHKAKMYSAAQNGRYQEVLEEINQDSPLNEVLILLAAKNNNLAWELSRHLGESAVEYYVRAIAANRLDKYIEAESFLEKAFELDPSLIDIAKVDGDIIDLLDETDTSNINE